MVALTLPKNSKVIKGKTFNISESSEDQTSSSNSTEESILNKIRK